MEITINVHFDDRFTTAIEYLAAALNTNTFDYAKTAQAVVVAKQETTQATPEQPVPAAMPVNQSVEQLTMATPVQAPIQAPAQEPAIEPAAITPPAAVPTATPTYTMDQLAVAATQLMDAGRRTEIVALLEQFGVQALTLLPKGQYGAFATQLRAMGAKI